MIMLPSNGSANSDLGIGNFNDLNMTLSCDKHCRSRTVKPISETS